MMAKKLYSLTEQHRETLKPWAEKWIANAMSTTEMTLEDRDICRDAVNRLYEGAGLKRPKGIYFVSSPFQMCFLGAMLVAGDVADERAVTFETTWTPDTKWWVTKRPPLSPEARTHLKTMHQHWQGGNQWSAYDAYLSWFRHIAQLDIDYSKWDAWETLSLHSGPRLVHEDFCIVSDRPEVLLVDDRNRPHCDDGPFCRWRDGSALYSIHGVHVPAWILERHGDITIAAIEAEQNAEIRRIMIGKIGVERYTRESHAEVIDHDEEFGTLYRILREEDTPIMVVEVVNNTAEADGTFKHYWLRVQPELRPMVTGTRRKMGAPQELTALNAVASTWGKTGEEFRNGLRQAKAAGILARS